MCAMDRWALDRLAELAGRCRAAYESFEFHVIFQAVHNFCAVDLSAVYLDIAKDRMYCSDAANPARRSGQTAMFHVLDATLRLTAPILSFTADEAWGYLPGAKAESVHLAPFPEIPAEWRNDAVAETWAKVLAVRGEVNRTIERLRADKVVGNSLDVAVEIAVPDDLRAVLVSLGGDGGEDLRRVLIVSSARIVEHLDGDGVQVSETVPGLAVRATATAAPKCERCWTREETVGANAEHPALCARCVREIDPAVRAAYAR
jgi:isoleucyl-tRNA synthetase